MSVYSSMLSSAFRLILFIVTLIIVSCSGDSAYDGQRSVNFNEDWHFIWDSADFSGKIAEDGNWRKLDLPHDWSIEGSFSPKHPATVGGGALPGGVGWYRKYFTIPEEKSGQKFFIHFDGVYMNSEVYLNGNLLGKRPNGYISFRYDLTPYLEYGDNDNVIAVKVDNSRQPNSRWYSGSGIYRNVYLVNTGMVHEETWGTFITTPEVKPDLARVVATSTIRNDSEIEKVINLVGMIRKDHGQVTGKKSGTITIPAGQTAEIALEFELPEPDFWSVEEPNLYSYIMEVHSDGKIMDRTKTDFGVRTFRFDSEKGFFLNGEPLKILGVCNHHDLGCLGSAVNRRAIERQLELLKEMGCNAIRTAHNPPAPELLELCDQMGFLVMDETFDMWKKKKSPYDYSLYWDEWHARDLRDHILRDRNHPSVFLWSIGNEIIEQWDSTGTAITHELAGIVRSLDTTRQIVTGNNFPYPGNTILQAGEMDIIGFNYKHNDFEKFPELFPGKCFIATETTSGLMTRGHYDMPSDSIRRWPVRWDRPFTGGNPDHTVSAYDNVSTPWGSTHEEAWSLIKKHDYLSGMFIWTGFDYLGEPTPYGWPSRSSYFGILDLAGFPKDVYHMYRSEWTDEPVLHLFPHWNWEEGKLVDVLAYTNCESVELFLNGVSMGSKVKEDTMLHLAWRLNYIPGELKAVGKFASGEVIEASVRTAGEPAVIRAVADRDQLAADGSDLSFVTIDILDGEGNLVPDAANLVTCKIEGDASIAGTDNGNQVSHEPFKTNYRKAFNGKCLFVLRAGKNAGNAIVTFSAENLEPATITLSLK